MAAAAAATVLSRKSLNFWKAKVLYGSSFEGVSWTAEILGVATDDAFEEGVDTVRKAAFVDREEGRDVSGEKRLMGQ